MLKKTRRLSSTPRTVKEEYQIIQELRQEFGFSLTEILPYTTIRRSTFYYQVHRREPEDNQELLQIIKDIKHQNPGYGYRPVTDELHRRGIRVNHKRVNRLMRENGLSSQMYNRQTRKY
ncbi:IS3 family transposase, partial [Limosilactobacillus oris]|uniref:IS3 family transposase n=1 Tax=Limosilactobacillus oris TaxID=1632 RepID=UPI003A520B33